MNELTRYILWMVVGIMVVRNNITKTAVKMKKGSEWNIWDLHVHTPASLVHHYEAGADCDVWEQYIRDLESLPKEVKVLGINDYLFIDGYKKVLEYKAQGRLQNIELILPVVEFRLSQFGGNKQFSRVNFHVIFSNEVDADVILAQFLSALQNKYQLSPEYDSMSWGGVITKENLEDLGRRIIASVPENQKANYGSELMEGFNNLNLSYKDIMEVLGHAPQYFEGKYLTAIGKTEWADIKWNDNTIAEKKNIINSVDFVFTASESVDGYSAALKSLTESKVNNRLLDCSDAHRNSTSTDKDRIGNCHCWIKAETTFEGLKQVLYEPEERMAVSQLPPQMKNSYQIIDRVELEEAGFWNDVIEINPNLNTIIGGRATGKSTLLKAIASKQANVKLKEEDDFVSKHLTGVKVIWADGNEHPENQIDFFHQSYMHELAEDKDALNNVLKGIIAEKDEQHILSTYESNNNQLKGQLARDILSIFQNRELIKGTTTKIRDKGNKNGITKEVGELKTKLLELSKGAAMSDAELTQYQQQSEQIAGKEKQIVTATHDVSLLKASLQYSVVNGEYIRVSGLDGLEYGENKTRVHSTFKTLQTKAGTAWKTYIEQTIKTTEEAIEKLKTEIAAVKDSDLFKKGLKFYADNKEIGDLKTKIEEEEKKITEIELLEKELQQQKAEESRLFEAIITNHLSYFANTQQVIDNLKFETEGLLISTQRRLRQNDLNGFLENALNQRSGERQQYLADLELGYATNTETTIRDFLKRSLDGEIVLKNYNEIQQVVTRLLSENWFVIDYELFYQNDTFAQMSSGKQAFVILKLLLDFSDKKNPILIDQPEDSLDNRAIFNELVTYIIRKKKERQIILVTHNPNVVVSSDTENVIVANQQGNDSKNDNGCRFQYVSGALENNKPKDKDCEYVLQSQGIREHVCEILEGGKAAFIKREQKYGFRH